MLAAFPDAAAHRGRGGLGGPLARVPPAGSRRAALGRAAVGDAARRRDRRRHRSRPRVRHRRASDDAALSRAAARPAARRACSTSAAARACSRSPPRGSASGRSSASTSSALGRGDARERAGERRRGRGAPPRRARRPAARRRPRGGQHRARRGDRSRRRVAAPRLVTSGYLVADRPEPPATSTASAASSTAGRPTSSSVPSRRDGERERLLRSLPVRVNVRRDVAVAAQLHRPGRSRSAHPRSSRLRPCPLERGDAELLTSSRTGANRQRAKATARSPFSFLMLLTITPPTAATDLGFLLHKHPERVRSRSSSPFGKAHVFYPEATDERCTAALLLDVDPVGLVRGRGGQRRAAARPVRQRPAVRRLVVPERRDRARCSARRWPGAARSGRSWPTTRAPARGAARRRCPAAAARRSCARCSSRSATRSSADAAPARRALPGVGRRAATSP